MTTPPFVTVLADPPWEYDDKLRMSRVKRSSTDQYKTTMSVEEICGLYQPSRHVLIPRTGQVSPARIAHYPIADVGFLALWTPANFLLDGSAVAVCRAWGYTPKQIVPWIKGRVRQAVATGENELHPQIGMGWITRVCSEYLILATRGKYTALLKSKAEPGLIVAPRTRHSVKPQEAYELIERVCPGPYLELFARERRAGWTSHGNELPPITHPDTAVEWPATGGDR